MTIQHQTDNLNRQSRPKKVTLQSTFAIGCAVFDQNSKNDRMWRSQHVVQRQNGATELISRSAYCKRAFQTPILMRFEFLKTRIDYAYESTKSA